MANEVVNKDRNKHTVSPWVVINCLGKKARYKGIESKHTEGRNRKDISGEIRLSKDTVKRKA